MMRQACRTALVVLLSSSPLWAQIPTPFTISAESADVHKSPSTGSPVVGRAPRGAILQVTRELGSWVKVAWPAAPDGVGYVHASLGSFSGSGPRPIPTRSTVAPSTAPAPAPAPKPSPTIPPPAPAPTKTATREPAASTEQRPPLRTGYVRPPAHALGFGGRIGVAQPGFGGTARMWSRDQFGVQLEVSRVAVTSAFGLDRLTSIQFAPSVLVSPHSRVLDYFSLRPYAAVGASIQRQTLTGVQPIGDASSDRSFALQTFGGAELTFASLPQFALSADAGYRQKRTPYPGFEIGGVMVGISGHWYVR